MDSQALNTRPEQLLKFGSSQRLPVIRQTEVAECGLACLAMVCGYYGYETDMSSLRAKFSISSHGTTLKDIIEMASRLKLVARALRLEPESLGQ